ncbi:bacterial transferase hexapeptide domain containing protein [Musa troglodytarum]|uniref:Bacterial transferase hexapeptide domain containing protein n=1 Tax=Musa troglodytarum TaxID=320322 RepID=A0A9E7F828_9LILI|nr:bacterial transferase hexapeptide domain containing protein [Musa troglodytarum]
MYLWAPSASVIGDVEVGHGSSTLYGCVLRGDANSIRVGTGTNIRDDSLVHVAKSNPSGKVLPTIIGDNVCQCVILISVCPGSINVYFDSGYEEDIPAFVGMMGWLWKSMEWLLAEPLLYYYRLLGWLYSSGSSQKKRAFISQSATDYCNLAQAHAVENAKPFDEVEFEKVLRKKFARRDEENDSMLGVVREVPPELILPDNIPLTNLPSLLNRFRSGGMVNLLRWTGVERNV